MKYSRPQQGMALLLSIILCFSLLPSPALAALPTPTIELDYTCDTSVPGVGSKLTFTLKGTNTVDVCLMIVDPFSNISYVYQDVAEVELCHPGVYTFIAYGVNSLDTSEPGFLRCMSFPVQITLAGPIATPEPLQPGSAKIMAWLDQGWQTMNGQEIHQLSLNLCILGNYVPEQSQLDVILSSGSGCRQPLYSGPASSVLTADSASLTDQIACALSADSGLQQLFGQGYFKEFFTIEACFTLPDGQTASAQGALFFDNYTNQMNYIQRFISSMNVPFATAEGAKLKAWLDMSPRSEGARNNSGYLLMEQQYLDLDQRDWAYYIGTGGLKVLESIGTVGVNLISGAITESEMKELFPKTGNKGYTYYQLLSNLYLEYAAALYQKMSAADEGLQLAENIIGGTVDVVTLPQAFSDAQEAQQLMIAMNEAQDMLIISNMRAGSGNVKQITIQERFGSAMLYTSPNSLKTESAVLDELLDTPRQGGHLVIDLSQDMHSLGAEEMKDYFYSHMQYSSVDTKAFRELNIESITGALETIEHTPDYKQLTAAQKQVIQDLKADTAKAAKEKGRFLSEKAGKVMDALDAGAAVFSAAADWMQYCQQLDQVSGYQELYFSILANVTDDYIDMLDNWHGLLANGSQYRIDNAHAALSYEKNTDWEIDWEMDAIREALALVKKDILATQDKNSQTVAQRIQDNTGAFTNGSLLSAAVSTLEVVCKIPAVQKAIQSMGAAIINQVAKLTGKSASAISASLAKFNAATILAQIAHLILSNTVGGVFSHYDSLKQLVSLQYSLTGNFYTLLQDYIRQPSHEGACACIAALNMIKLVKQQGEKLVEIYYLKDFYKDLGIENNETLQAILLNEYSASHGYLDIDKYLQPVHQWIKSVPGEGMWGAYFLPEGSRLEYYIDGKKLTPLPSDLADTPSYSEVITQKHIDAMAQEKIPLFIRAKNNTITRFGQGANIDRIINGTYNIQGNRLTPQQIQSLPNGSVILQQQANADPIYYLEDRHSYQRGALEYVLTDIQMESYRKVEDKINEILAIDEDDLSIFSFGARNDLDNLNKLAWVRITGKYIESLEMYDDSKIY